MSDGGSDIGLIGLAVMGQNLVLNMADHGFRVIAYNRTTEKTRAFVDPLPEDSGITGAETLEALVDGLASAAQDHDDGACGRCGGRGHRRARAAPRRG